MKSHRAFALLVLVTGSLAKMDAQSATGSSLSLGQGLVISAGNAGAAWIAVNALATKRLDQQKLVSGVDPVTLLSQVDQSLQTAQAAKAFYTAYPSDPNAQAAKKMEVLSTLQAVEQGDTGAVSAAAVLATAYLGNTANSASDRFDVAMVNESIALAPVLHGKQLSEDGASYLKCANDLRAQIGDTPKVWSLYLSVLRTTDLDTRKQVAAQVAQTATAPGWLQKQAQTEQNRLALVGAVFKQKFTTVGGDTVDLTQSAGLPTLLIVWNGSNPAELARWAALSQPVGTRANWIYLALGGPAAPTASIMASAPVPGRHCFERAPFGGPLGKALLVDQTPFVYAFNQAGVLCGFGTPAALQTLFNLASQ